jgi:hypothetical protein
MSRGVLTAQDIDTRKRDTERKVWLALFHRPSFPLRHVDLDGGGSQKFQIRSEINLRVFD